MPRGYAPLLSQSIDRFNYWDELTPSAPLIKGSSVHHVGSWSYLLFIPACFI